MLITNRYIHAIILLINVTVCCVYNKRNYLIKQHRLPPPHTHCSVQFECIQKMPRGDRQAVITSASPSRFTGLNYLPPVTSNVSSKKSPKRQYSDHLAQKGAVGISRFPRFSKQLQIRKVRIACPGCSGPNGFS